MEVNKIYHGDALDVLRNFPADTFDLICTDPPYGYSFMGKAWDRAVVAVEYWKECLRVLKPGAFCFVMSAPRQDVLARAMMNLEEAGFATGFTSIYWVYASGFPKATNMGKAVDKRLGNKRKIIGEREVIDIRGNNWNRGNCNHISHKVTKGSSPFEGSYAGFQPKPAVEVILVSMKPLCERSYVDQALKNRKGITWLDDGRIPYESGDRPTGGFGGMGVGIGRPLEHQGYRGSLAANPAGRFPANLLVAGEVLNGQDNFSRFFDFDKWAQRTFPFLVVAKASKREKGRSNHHPTVKPLKLMAYFIAIGSRQGDIVLDPFVGSGTTAVAAQQLGRRWVGIELDEGYRKLAERRLAHATNANGAKRR